MRWKSHARCGPRENRIYGGDYLSALGSQFGLKKILKETYPDKKIYTVGEMTNQCSFMGSHDKIDDDIFNDSLVIILDVGDKRRIHDERWEKAKKLIKIDHHPKTEEFCDIEWIDTSFSATAEMITDLYMENIDRLKMTKDAARDLYTGILTDSGRFYYNSVTERTLRYGAQLYKFDFDKQELYKHIYLHPLKIVKYKGYILGNFVLTDNGVGYIKIYKEVQKRFEISADVASTFVNTLANIEEVIVWIFFTEDEELGKIKCGFRSRGPSVNELATKYGGGGHELASGALVDNWKDVESIIYDAEELCKKIKNK